MNEERELFLAREQEEQLYSICVQETPVKWLASVKKQTTATAPRYAKTFDKVEADRIVQAFKRLGFVQNYVVVEAPPEAL